MPDLDDDELRATRKLNGVAWKEDIIEELTKIRPDKLSTDGLKLFEKINEIIDENKQLKLALANSVSKDEIKKLIDYIEEEGYWEFITDRDSDTARELLQELLNKGE